jgi:hypothetical protein
MSRSTWSLYLIAAILLHRTYVALALYSYAKGDMGSLTGDVQNWAMLVQNYILQVSYLRVPGETVRTNEDGKTPSPRRWSANWITQVPVVELVTHLDLDLFDEFVHISL